MIEQVLFSQKQIAKRVAQLGKQIAADYSVSERPLVLLGVLRGSVVFCADLMRAIDRAALYIDFIGVSSYGASCNSSGDVRLTKDCFEDLEGKDVLIVEDIADTGCTIDFLKNTLGARNPASLRIACLLDKPSRRKVELTPDYVGFSIPDVFAVGYGLDCAQLYRNLPYIAVLNPDR